MTLQDAPVAIDVPLVDLAAQHAEVADEIEPASTRCMATTGFVGGPQGGRLRGGARRRGGASHVRRRGQRHRRPRADAAAGGSARATRSSSRPTRSSPPPPPSCGPGPTPVFVDVDPTYLLIDPARSAARSPRAPAASCRAPVRADRADGDAARRSPPAPASTRRGRRPGAGRRRNGTSAGRDRRWPPRPASTRARTSAPTATPAPCSPTTTSWPSGARAAPTTAPARKYDHPSWASTRRLDAMQAVVLSAKLRAARRAGTRRGVQAAARYDELLGRPARRVAARRPWPATSTCGTCTSSACPAATGVLEQLQRRGIGAGVHYPMPIHLQGAFAGPRSSPGGLPHRRGRPPSGCCRCRFTRT